jgi:hypothetical protein
MSQLIEAAQGTRSASNEKSTSTKKDSGLRHQEFMEQIAGVSEFHTGVRHFDPVEEKVISRQHEYADYSR